MPADTTEVTVEDGLDKAMQSYRRFLDETPEGAMTPEAMRRLADLKLEKEYGILGDGKIVEVDAEDHPPKVEAKAIRRSSIRRSPRARLRARRRWPHRCPPQRSTREPQARERRNAIQPAAATESERALEQRAMAQQPGVPEESAAALDVPEGVGGDSRTRVPSKPSNCTTRCSRSIRTTPIATRCFTRRPARMTSSDARPKP